MKLDDYRHADKHGPNAERVILDDIFKDIYDNI